MGQVAVNPPKTPVTKGSNGIAAATMPNVCKMPGPPAPFVPTPLPNIGKSGDSPQGYSKTVTIEGHTVAIQGSSFGSMGDAASKGTGGGLVSMNTHGPTKFLGPGSFDVKIEGKNVHLLSDQMLNNCGPSGSPPNSATMAGVVLQPGQEINADTHCMHCGNPLDEHQFQAYPNDDEGMKKEAHSGKKPFGTGNMVGAMQVGDRAPVKSRAGGTDVTETVFNLKTKKAIPVNKDQKIALERGGNGLGNCCEQKMLKKEFLKPDVPFPPEGMPDSIKMFVGPLIKGTPSKKEIDKARHEPPCDTCQKVLVAMFCTDTPATRAKPKGR
jgi:hypothetical protein